MKRTLSHSSTPAVATGLVRRSARRARACEGMRAFTLVELLVVIAIIGILAGITYPAVESVIQRAKKANTRALIDNIDAGISMFKTGFGHVPYADDTGDTDGEIPDSPEDRQEYVRLWLLGLDYEGEPDGTHVDKSSRAVRQNMIWNGPYVEVRAEKHLDEENEYFFMDGWRNPLYFEFYDPEVDAGEPLRNKPIFNIDRWDIWSKGPDEKGTEDMQDVGSDGDSYKKRLEKWEKVEDEPEEYINRDNVVNN